MTMADVGAVPQPVGPRLRIARENAGLTTEQLASQLGVRVDTLTDWEDGAETPRANRLVTLAGLLNVSLTWLLEGREDAFMHRQGLATPDSLRAQVETIRVRLSDLVELVEDLQQRLEDLEDSEAEE